MKKHLKSILAVIILAVTTIVFAYYVNNHPEVWQALQATNPGILVLLVGIYFGWFVALALMTRFSLQFYHKPMGKQENLLFNAYSSLINFFGPGQSGPIFRGVYLKKRHGVTVKQYLFVTLIYYGFYAIISACLLFIGSRPWWQTLLLMFAAGVGSFVVIRWYKLKKLGSNATLNLPAIGLIFITTVMQLAALCIAYGIELHSVGAAASVGEILSYTGAANFSLFVALTPGAIGIREAFLVFSQGLHHISNNSIVAANVLDRAAYVLFLGILFIITLSLHAKDKLKLSQLRTDERPE